MPSISNSTVEQIRSIPIEQVIGKHVELKKSGANYVGISPFTPEKTPSFTVFVNTNTFKCFSSGEGGDNFKFIQKKMDIGFYEAIEFLAREHSIEIEYANIDPEKEHAYKAEQERKTSISTTLNIIQNYFIQNELPLTSKTKQWNAATRQKFGIGYALDGWGNLISDNPHLSVNQLIEADLVTQKNQKQYAKFRNRIMFPTYDHIGRLVGYTGRDADPEGDKKYKYMYTGSDVWTKGDYLYGLHIAKDEIKKQGFAYLVEGQTDVIAMHRKTRANTVGMGSSRISTQQVKQLRNYTDSVVLVPDNDLDKTDNPGISTMHKCATDLIKAGFDVKVLIVGDPTEKKSVDPEEWLNSFTNKSDLLDKWFSTPQHYITEYALAGLKLKTGVREKTKAIDYMSQLIALIPNDSERKLTTTEVEKLWADYKSITAETKKEQEQHQNKAKGVEMERTKYVDGYGKEWSIKQPKGLDYEANKDFFEKHGYVEFENRVWVGNESWKNKTIEFRHASNFVWKSLFHLYDDQFPKRLLRIRNVQGTEKIIDAKTDELATPSSFAKWAERCGNYIWDLPDALKKVKEYQFANETSGVLLETLGHQKQGFYVFSNGAYDYKFDKWIPANENGVIEVKHKNYYIQSGNQIYADSEHKFGTEKAFIYKKGTINFSEWCSLYMGAYGQNAMVGAMFGIATVFNDHIYSVHESFPLFFLMGKGGSGKGALVKRVLRWFGEDRQPLKLSSEGNTVKGIIRSFAQYSNTPILMDEFINERKQTELLKSVYDKDGYTKAVVDSRFGTETTPCLSSAMVTTNDEPTDEPLLQRLIYIQINDAQFSQEQENDYLALKDEEGKGVGQVLLEILKHRVYFEEQFKDVLRSVKKEINHHYQKELPKKRVRDNISVLLACYDVIAKKMAFPFERETLLNYLVKLAYSLIDKINEGGEVAKFFSVLQIMFQKSDFNEDVHFSLDENYLYVRYSYAYNIYQKYYYDTYKVRPPSKSALQDSLKRSDAFVESLKSHRFTRGSNTSALKFDFEKTGFQINDQSNNNANF